MFKKKLIFLLGVLSIVSFSFSFKSPIDCREIRNGRFYYISKKSREKINVYRQDSLQLEMGSKADDIPLKCRVVWISDCEYDMYMNAFSDRHLIGFDSIMAATPLHIKILHIDTAFYVCLANFQAFGKSLELRDTLYFAR